MYDQNKYGHIIDPFDPSLNPVLAKRRWPDQIVGVFDVETTGVNYENPDEFRIVQFSVGLYRMPDKDHTGPIEPVEFHNWFIDPEMAIPPGAMGVHGLYHSDYNDWADIEKHGKKDIAMEPNFEYVVEDICEVMDKPPLWCAYNHTFDVCALQSERRRIGLDEWWKPTIDPLPWQRYRRSKMSGNTLWKTAKRYGVATHAKVLNDEEGEELLHDARTDIQLLNDVLWAMQPRMPLYTYDLFRRQCHLLRKHEEHYYKRGKR